jgi:indole-3-glycerol phosphate synthase
MILDRIVASTKIDLARRQECISIDMLKEALADTPPVRPFKPALRRPGQVSVIAETKRSSPSKGLLRQDYDCVKIAAEYEQAGAAAVSVLTEARFFQGHQFHLIAVRKKIGIPVLRKDFIIDPYQVYSSRVLGADAVLLIAAILSPEQMAELMALAANLGMACLAEVHTEKELAAALDAGADIIGINNRDLKTFETDINRTLELLDSIDTQTITVVSESGIKSRADILKLGEKGVHAVLVGETLMRSAKPGEKLKELIGVSDGGPVEVC